MGCTSVSRFDSHCDGDHPAQICRFFEAFRMQVLSDSPLDTCTFDRASMSLTYSRVRKISCHMEAQALQQSPNITASSDGHHDRSICLRNVLPTQPGQLSDLDLLFLWHFTRSNAK